MNLTILSPAKVNLFLRILEPDDDGYHPLQSLFATISLFDQLEVTLNPSARLVLSVSNPATRISPETDLVYRASDLFFRHVRRSCALDITVIKNIPVGAGLGGGSSNAASILRTLNGIFGYPFTDADLRQLGFSLGSDIPFFIDSGVSYVSGKGEIVRPVSRFPSAKLLLISDLSPSPTKSVYQSFDRRQVYPVTLAAAEIQRILKSFTTDNIETARFRLFNDLEAAFFDLQPRQKALKHNWESSLQIPLFLSGSGSMFFSPLSPGEARRLTASGIIPRLQKEAGFCRVVDLLT